MRLKTFLAFVSPSVLAMILLIAVPLMGVMYLSVYNSYVKTEIVEVESKVPTFAGMTQTKIEKVPQPVLDENGQPIKISEFVGGRNFDSVADPKGLVEAFTKDRSLADDGSATTFDERMRGVYGDLTDIDFWSALEFTLLYALVTTPCVLFLGFLVALAINSVTKWIRGPLIFASLLPFIITYLRSRLAQYQWSLSLYLSKQILMNLLVHKYAVGQIDNYSLSTQLNLL